MALGPEATTGLAPWEDRRIIRDASFHPRRATGVTPLLLSAVRMIWYLADSQNSTH